MQYFSHTITTKLRTTKRWHNQLTIFNITHFQLEFQIIEKSINEILYTLLFIEIWVEPNNRLYNPPSYKGERKIQGKTSRLIKLRNEGLQSNLRLSQCSL